MMDSNQIEQAIVDMAGQSAQRLAILSIAVFILAGLLLLLLVNEQKAREAAEIAPPD